MTLFFNKTSNVASSTSLRTVTESSSFVSSSLWKPKCFRVPIFLLGTGIDALVHFALTQVDQISTSSSGRYLTESASSFRETPNSPSFNCLIVSIFFIVEPIHLNFYFSASQQTPWHKLDYELLSSLAYSLFHLNTSYFVQSYIVLPKSLVFH